MTDNRFEKDRLRTEIDNLRRSATEQSLLSNVHNTTARIRSYADTLKACRQQGYAFADDLDAQIANLMQRWPKIEMDALDVAQSRARKLDWELQDLQEMTRNLDQAEGSSFEIQRQRATSEINRLREQVQEAERQVMTTMQDLPEQSTAIGEQLSRIQSTLKHAQGASFTCDAGEMIFIAVKAAWRKTEKETIEGVLYLTNQRLIMEQDQKKGSFMGLGGSRTRQLCWASPYSSVLDVTSKKEGMLGRIELIQLRFGPSDPISEATIEVKEGVQADWFGQQLRRAQSGALAQDRNTGQH